MQLHEIAFYSKGGYDWYLLYNMPIWIRRLAYNQISEYYQERNKALNGDSNTSDSDVNSIKETLRNGRPQFLPKEHPDYMSKIKKGPKTI